MTISAWWLILAASLGVALGIVLFALLSMAARNDPDRVRARGATRLPVPVHPWRSARPH